MKRMVVLAMMMACFALPCLAQQSRVEMQDGALIWLDFDEHIPPEAQDVFSGMLQEYDRVISGALQERRLQQEAILAVEREGKILLMGACRPTGETAWRTAVESDSFFVPGMSIDITVEPVYDGLGNLYDRRLLICYGEERYSIGLYESGAMRIESYAREEIDGSRFCITLNSGWISCDRYSENLRERLYNAHAVVSSRLAVWTHETFPKDEQVVRRVAEAYPLDLDIGEVYVSGGNLREQPTSASVSWGQYCAKANVADRKMGIREPWIQVKIGQLTGWMSDNYVLTQEDDPARVYSAASATTQVARVDAPTILHTFPDSHEGVELPVGTLLHVLMEKDGWLHVIDPQEEITWRTDWDGAYGFIRAEDASVGISIVDVKWRE